MVGLVEAEVMVLVKEPGGSEVAVDPVGPAELDMLVNGVLVGAMDVGGPNVTCVDDVWMVVFSPVLAPAAAPDELEEPPPRTPIATPTATATATARQTTSTTAAIRVRERRPPAFKTAAGPTAAP